MAITTLANPINKTSAHDDLWHVATSDNANNVDFKYVFDVYSQGKQLIRAKVFPDPSNQKGYFNVSNIVSNEMKFDWFKPNPNVFTNKILNASGEIFLDYEIKVGEDVAGVTTTNMESGIVTVANCVPNLYRRRSILIATNKFYFLTNRDRITTTAKDESFYIGIHYLEGNPEAPNRIVVKEYTGNIIRLTRVVISYTSPLTNVIQLNISKSAIENKTGVSFNGNTDNYIIELQALIGDTWVMQDAIRLYFDCKTKYESINLHFMNNYGLFDTARFNLASRLSMEAERKTFEKSDYKLGNNVTYNEGSNQYFESKINYGSKYQWSYKLTMDFPSDTDYEWLDELIMSPQVWAEIKDKGTTEYYPVSIKATNYEYSKHINNRLRAFEVEIDMNQKRNGFRR